MLTEAFVTPQSGTSSDGPVFQQLVLEFVVAALATAQDAFGNLNSAILFAATARACGPFDQQPGRRRPVSINALAASLDRPFETTRRHANWLVEQGLAERSDQGLSIPFAAIADPRVTRLVDRCHDLLVRLVELAGQAGLALPAPRADTAYDPRAGIGIALDLLLAAVESHGQREENFTRLALMLAVEWACGVQRAAERDAAPRDAAPRDTVAAVRASRIARIIGLPYATAARNLEALVANSRLARAGSALRPASESAAMIAARDALGNRARQLLGRLAQAGFPVGEPGVAYIQRRPTLPDPR